MYSATMSLKLIMQTRCCVFTIRQPTRIPAQVSVCRSNSSGTTYRLSARRLWRKTGQQSPRSEEHTSELQSHLNLVCRLLLEKKNKFRHPTDDDRSHKRADLHRRLTD